MVKFVENYVKENNLKLLPHHKSMLKAIEDGKMTYYHGRSNGRSILAEAIKAYCEHLEENQ